MNDCIHLGLLPITKTDYLQYIILIDLYYDSCEVFKYEILAYKVIDLLERLYLLVNNLLVFIKWLVVRPHEPSTLFSSILKWTQ